MRKNILLLTAALMVLAMMSLTDPAGAMVLKKEKVSYLGVVVSDVDQALRRHFHCAPLRVTPINELAGVFQAQTS